jgi:hypothetical protein
MKDLLYWFTIFSQIYIFIGDRYEPEFLKIDLLWGFRFSPLIEQVIPACSSTNNVSKVSKTYIEEILKERDMTSLELISLLGLPNCSESNNYNYVWTNFTLDGKDGWKIHIKLDENRKASHVTVIKSNGKEAAN